MEPFLRALQAVFPSAVRVGETLRIPEPGGGWRLLAPRAPWDPQVDHGMVVPFLPPLDESYGLDACHLRGRLLRSPDAIEAARAYGEGRDVEANANILAVETARQLSETWAPLVNPVAWTGPGTTFVLQSVNCAPVDADALVGLLKAAAFTHLGKPADGRPFLAKASQTTDLRLRGVWERLRTRMADA